MTLYSVFLSSPSASSISRAVSTLKPCSEKYSLIEKQIDSSSSTTNKRGIGISFDGRSVRPPHIRLNLPETFLSVPNRFCFTTHVASARRHGHCPFQNEYCVITRDHPLLLV